MWPGIWNILDGWFFGPAAQGPRPRACSLRILGYPYAVIRDLLRGRGQPARDGTRVCDAAVDDSAARVHIRAPEQGRRLSRLRPVIFDFFRPIGPNAGEVTDQVLQFATSVSSGLVGGVGFALLLWTLLGATRKVEDSFNFIWHVEIRRSFPRRVAAHLGLLVIGPLLLIAFIALTKSVLDYADLSDVVGGRSRTGSTGSLSRPLAT